MREPTVDLDIDDNLNATLVMTCGNCRRTTRVPLKQATPNRPIKCSCGAEVTLTGDDLRKTQKQLDDFKKTLDGFGG